MPTDPAHTVDPEASGLGSARISRSRRRSKWQLLLLLPYIGLCFPQMYTRATPALWGFPYFYWYQFAWVLLTSALLGVVYRGSRPFKEADGTPK